MIIKKINKNIIKILPVIIILTFSFSISLNSLSYIIGSGNSFNIEELDEEKNLNKFNYENIIPESSYLPRDTDGIMPVGNISVNSIVDLADGEFYVENFGILINDVIDGKINPEYNGFDFLGVSKIADDETAVYVNNHFEDYITITINETARFDYWYNDTRALISFKSNISDDGILKNITINGTSIDIDDPTTFNITGGGYIFNYTNFRPNVEYPNGTLIVGYEIEYDLVITDWRIIQYDKPRWDNDYMYIEDVVQEVGGYYNYTFNPDWRDLGIIVNLSINLPDIYYLSDFSLTKCGVDLSEGDPIDFGDSYNNKQLPNTTIQLFADPDELNNSATYCISFYTIFTVEFKNPHASFWCNDFLYSGNDIRERRYEISCISGPSSLLIRYFGFNESTIPLEDITSISSAFGRNIMHSDMNTSTVEGGTLGVTVFYSDIPVSYPYYLALGETDVITIRYRSQKRINLLLLDTINIPITGAEVVLYYEGVVWGSVMSNDKTYPIASKISDSTGQIMIPDLADGNYTIEISYNNEFIMNISVDPDLVINIINTPIPHFPTWILIYNSIFVIITVIGFFLYNKNRQPSR